MASLIRKIMKKLPGARFALKKMTSTRTPVFDRESINQQLQVGLLANYRSQFRIGQRPFD